ncbi:glucose 1-dehydrogenase [Luteolibacter ambystomatis]|uniref:Glucose 1-dehydrogenase n=1 Tax=Luteolibacter ambystomatis TaxID=2824561 RepID=A0A975PGV4_9BACT|nr:glucose 1-dehydrogenase [Luteolibacter ambystomatis]QUE52960.1 glucose 1-dehydrogenase [Luteolibacter ambystomatis]
MSTTISKKLAGKHAIVTGASKGIGASIARLLAAEGASVIVNYASSRDGADRVVAEITGAGGKALAVQADVSKQEDITRLIAESVAAYGPIDILVNNAGIYQMAPLEEVTAESFQQQFGLNVLGLLLTTKEAVKQFNPTGGSVINISSVVSTYAPPGSSVYSGTKGAVDTITRVLSKELGARGIRVNAINPGMVDTEGTRSAGITADESEFRKHLETISPLGRIGRPDDIGSAAVFLASDDSSWVTGELFYIAGGLH